MGENQPQRSRLALVVEDAVLWALIVLLVVLWVGGFFVIKVGGALIHLLLIVAILVLIYQFATGGIRL